MTTSLRRTTRSSSQHSLQTTMTTMTTIRRSMSKSTLSLPLLVSTLFATTATAAATASSTIPPPAATTTDNIPYLRKQELSGSWQSLDQGLEFLPAHAVRRLEDEDAQESYLDHADDDVYKVQPFVDGLGDYDEYQQAWRLLGFMIDCHSRGNDDDYYDYVGEGCHRYVLWAAVSEERKRVEVVGHQIREASYYLVGSDGYVYVYVYVSIANQLITW